VRFELYHTKTLSVEPKSVLSALLGPLAHQIFRLLVVHILIFLWRLSNLEGMRARIVDGVDGDERLFEGRALRGYGFVVGRASVRREGFLVGIRTSWRRVGV